MIDMEAHNRMIGRVSEDEEEGQHLDPDEYDEDDDNDDVDEDEDGEENGRAGVGLGGTIGTAAFALLVGQVEDPVSKMSTTCEIPVTRLPATLGRTHSSADPSFIALGKHKSLSRQHFTIFYRDANGGRLGQYGVEEELIYQAATKIKSENGNGDTSSPNDVILPQDYKEENLPSDGFFAVECLSKNKIFVGGQKVEQGQVALLQNETPMQIATHSLYFLLPIDSSAAGSHPASTIQVPNPAYETFQKKRARHRDKDKDPSSTSDHHHHQPSSKKQRTSSAGADAVTSGDFSPGSPTLPPPQAPASTTTTTHQRSSASSELDTLSLSTLMTRMTDAIENNQWDRKNQMLGSAISLHAVRDAAQSSMLARIAAREGGVCRGDVMKWIENSNIYATWVQQMLSKMELKSYQSNIGKALTRGGYHRTGTTGRHVRWTLPEDIVPASFSESEKEEVMEDNQQDDMMAGGKIKQESSEEESDDESDEEESDNANHEHEEGAYDQNHYEDANHGHHEDDDGDENKLEEDQDDSQEEEEGEEEEDDEEEEEGEQSEMSDNEDANDNEMQEGSADESSSSEESD